MAKEANSSRHRQPRICPRSLCKKQDLTPRVSAFKLEDEWRLVSKTGRPANICFRNGRSMLVPYTTLFLNTKKLPISEIVIGPGPHKELDEWAVVSLLKDKTAKPAGCVPLRCAVPRLAST